MIEGRRSIQAEANVQKPLVFRVLPSSIFPGQVAQEPLVTVGGAMASAEVGRGESSMVEPSQAVATMWLGVG